MLPGNRFKWQSIIFKFYCSLVFGMEGKLLVSASIIYCFHKNCKQKVKTIFFLVLSGGELKMQTWMKLRPSRVIKLMAVWRETSRWRGHFSKNITQRWGGERGCEEVFFTFIKIHDLWSVWKLFVEKSYKSTVEWGEKDLRGFVTVERVPDFCVFKCLVRVVEAGV